jgi:hypothetical protein
MPETASSLTPQLEARLAEATEAARHNDFDAVSWCWIFLLGVALPGGLILAGWLYAPSVH